MSETPLTDEYFGTLPPPISKRLCEKAAQQNDELTRAERWLLLCQGVYDAQFLADPASRTDENFNRALARPPPEILAENIKLAFGGGRTSIAEVLRDYWDPDRTEQLSYWAHECATLCWWTLHTGATYRRPPDADVSEAVFDAAGELAGKLRPQEMALEKAITTRYCGDMPRPQPTSEAYGGDVFEMQEASRTNEEWWVAADEWKHKCETEERALRKQLRKQVDDELSRAQKADLIAVRQLREMMDVEVAEEAEQDAAIARAEAEERAREEEQYQAERARKRKVKAEREEQQRKKGKKGGRG
ncbi:hypothetical protein NLG97_g5773 [Lecanicillium saksenae]|uniref:Uncharacterized protein n=1 Tax=Lecanicillium saksenae TaxID=468837 RepID=A0ACC1QT75_9HYPO|nr:hypothetical protein NLG97_g5773 [Lecanicillium saksenae]